MKGVPVPDREEDFTADPVELFFDLAFVFAFSRLVAHLVHHPDWAGVGEFALLFVMIWLPWTQFTWSANAVAGNSRPVRVMFLVATVASIPMAGSLTTALGDGGSSFAVSLAVILSMGLAMMIYGIWHEAELRASAVRYAAPNAIAIVLVIAGSFLDHDLRVVVWIGAMVVVIIGTVRAGSSEWLVRPGHFAERHGLIVIIALGEVVVALGLPVAAGLEAGDGLAGRTVVALIGAGIFAGLLWWGYFDRPLPALEHRHEALVGGRERGRFARDVYTYIHCFLVGGIILATAALEEITLHPTDSLPTAFRMMLLAGLTLYLGAVVVAIWRAFRAFAVERLVAIGVLTALVAVTPDVDGLVLLVLVDVVLAVVLVVEHRRIEVVPRSLEAAAAD